MSSILPSIFCGIPLLTKFRLETVKHEGVEEIGSGEWGVGVYVR